MAKCAGIKGSRSGIKSKWRWCTKKQKIREKKQQSIMEFRDASERQARLMMDVSEDLLEVLTKRVKQAQQQGEDVPLPLVAGLLRATANITGNLDRPGHLP